MSLVKYNPNLSPLFGEFQDFFDIFDTFDPMVRSSTRITNPKVDVDNVDGKHIITMATPGVSKDDVSVDIENNLMTVSYNQKKEHDSVFAVKSFSRSWKLPRTADIDNITASSENGVLVINVPDREEAKSQKKKIEII